MQILIAEDDPISRRLLQRHLEKWGHEVFAAEDGIKAWEIFQARFFPIVISDWMMPGIDGLELIKRIRSYESPGYVYTILLTAKGQKEDMIIGMEAGADDFLTKPFDADELKVRLRAGERIIKLEHWLADRNQALEEINSRMQRDLKAAAKIQEALLPSVMPEVHDVHSAWYFKPCDELAGDIFNFFKLDHQNLGLYVLDVSGHGVPAALLSVTLSRLLSPNPDQSNLLIQNTNGGLSQLTPPAKVADSLNKQFPIDPITGQYFTLLYGVLNVKTKKFTYVSAGHPGMICLPVTSDPSVLEKPGLPIGFSDSIQYIEENLTLNPGDRLILYSDGIIESRNSQGELYGKERFIQSLQNKKSISLNASIQQSVDELLKWSQTDGFEDDVTIVALEIKS